jgi:transcriptional regulator GlxA family with amidase domain
MPDCDVPSSVFVFATVALQAGFSDILHFNRLFRSRFGATPSDMRGVEEIAMQAQ